MLRKSGAADYQPFQLFSQLQRGVTGHTQHKSMAIDSKKSKSGCYGGEREMLQVDQGRQMQANTSIDMNEASQTLDALIDMITELLPVNAETYPELAESDRSEAIAFCLRHSALHFSKTAGKLAAFVEDADHGKYSEIEQLESIVAASLVNSLKLADEIGISGGEIICQIQEKFGTLTTSELQT